MRRRGAGRGRTERDLCAEPGPAAGRALERERPAQALHSIGEPAQAAALLVRPAGAVVGDADVDLSVAGLDPYDGAWRAPACFWTLASASATT